MKRLRALADRWAFTAAIRFWRWAAAIQSTKPYVGFEEISGELVPTPLLQVHVGFVPRESKGDPEPEPGWWLSTDSNAASHAEVKITGNGQP